MRGYACCMARDEEQKSIDPSVFESAGARLARANPLSDDEAHVLAAALAESWEAENDSSTSTED